MLEINPAPPSLELDQKEQVSIKKQTNLQSLTAVFHQAGEPLNLTEFTVPDLKPGEILIKIEYTTLCRSDVNTYSGKRLEKSPTILGHEIIGRIAGFGPHAQNMDVRGRYLSAGERVTWAIYATDPNDLNYIHGMPQKAERLYKYGHEQINDTQTLHGGLSEYIILKPYTPIIKIDERIPLPVAATINCTISTIAGAMRLLDNVAGKNILICGSGMLGMLAISMCKIKQANKIVVVDSNEERLALAPYFGASHIIHTSQFNAEGLSALLHHPCPFDSVIEVSGSNKAMQMSLDSLKIGGTAVWLGATFPQEDVCISAEKMVRKLLTIRGLHNYNIQDFIYAVEFIEAHHTTFPFESLIHQSFDLNQINEAFEYAVRFNPFRVGITMQKSL